MKKIFKVAATSVFASIFLAAPSLFAQSDVNLYINAGVYGDFNLDGYESAFVDREPRLGYQIEIGNSYFAIPVSYSGGQGVDILGVKPRFQYLFPLGIFAAGPGIGFVYNYWKSDLDVAGADFSVSVHEIGVQPSLQVMFRPLPLLNILLTPVAIDFNFWRNVEADTGIRGLGNFSTTNKDLGIIYSGGASLGLAF